MPVQVPLSVLKERPGPDPITWTVTYGRAVLTGAVGCELVTTAVKAECATATGGIRGSHVHLNGEPNVAGLQRVGVSCRLRDVAARTRGGRGAANPMVCIRSRVPAPAPVRGRERLLLNRGAADLRQRGVDRRSRRRREYRGGLRGRRPHRSAGVRRGHHHPDGVAHIARHQRVGGLLRAYARRIATPVTGRVTVHPLVRVGVRAPGPDAVRGRECLPLRGGAADLRPGRVRWRRRRSDDGVDRLACVDIGDRVRLAVVQGGLTVVVANAPVRVPT